MNFDCSALWVRDAEPLKAALSLTPEYLRAKGNMLDYKVRPRLHADIWLSVPVLGLNCPDVQCASAAENMPLGVLLTPCWLPRLLCACPPRSGLPIVVRVND